jgi:hypothetical protein
MVKGKKAPAKRQVPPPKRRAQPPSEEDLGGGDTCSLEEQPSIADDKPLDLRRFISARDTSAIVATTAIV